MKVKNQTKRKLDEGYTMSITQGEENTPDRVSVNATDAEADKLIKFVKDVGLGQYGDAEDAEADADSSQDTGSFYGSPEVEVEPNGSHDDMLKLMGIVDMGNGDFEDEVEAPGTDIDVQVDDAACESCGDKHAMEEGCGDKAYEDQGYNDREDEQLGMKDGKESGKKQSMHDRRDDSRGDFGHRHGGHLEEESDAEMDDHAERAGKEVAHDAHYDGRDHSGKDGEDVTKDLEYDDYKDHHMKEESEAEADDHAEEAGKRDHSNKIKDEDEYDTEQDRKER